MELNGEFLEDTKLNEEMSYLTLSHKNGYNSKLNEAGGTGYSNCSGIDDGLNSNFSNCDPSVGTNDLVENLSDDDVMFVGSSITVKTEKNDKSPFSPQNTYQSYDDSSVDYANDFNDSNSSNVNNQSGWLISNFKRAPKAHYIENANTIKKRNKFLANHPNSSSPSKQSLQLLDNIIDIKDLAKLPSQCSTVSNTTSYTQPTNYYFNYNDYTKRPRRKKGSLRELSCPAPYNYHFNQPSDDIMYNSDSSKGFSRYFNPERINSWLKTIFNVTKTIILIYIVVSLFLIVKKDIETHIQRNVKSVDNESLVCSNEYKRNKCGVLDIPAMVDKCREWEVCMKKDSLNYENISLISASVIASSIKHFISQLDIKSLLFIVFIFLLVLYRNRPQRPDYARSGYGVDASRGSERLNRYFTPNYMNKHMYPYVTNR